MKRDIGGWWGGVGPWVSVGWPWTALATLVLLGRPDPMHALTLVEQAAGQARSVEAEPIADGAELVAALGCAGCHTGLPSEVSVREVAPPLSADDVPLAPAYIFNYLADPQNIRPDIAPARMPRYDLDERTRLALALYVTNEIELRGVDEAFRAAQSRFPDETRETGKAAFEALGCAGCHTHPESEARQLAPDLSSEGTRVQGDWLRDYLARPTTIRPAGPEPGRGGQMPDFRLAPDEVETIASFLESQRAADFPAWTPGSLSPFSMQKAEALLRDRWSCLGCHQLGEDGGRVGPRLDGVGDRLQPAFVRALIEAPGHLVPGTIMPASLEQPDRLDLMASFLVQREAPWAGSEALGGIPVPGPPPVVLGDARGVQGSDAPAGEALYQRQCAVCHGVAGEGDGFNAPFLPTPPTRHADADSMVTRTDDTLYDGIHAGGWILGKSHRMPAFGASLEPAEIRALVSYIRVLCGCQGPAWSRDGRRGR